MNILNTMNSMNRVLLLVLVLAPQDYTYGNDRDPTLSSIIERYTDIYSGTTDKIILPLTKADIFTKELCIVVGYANNEQEIIYLLGRNNLTICGSRRKGIVAVVDYPMSKDSLLRIVQLAQICGYNKWWVQVELVEN